MLTGDGTSVTEAVLLAAENDLDVSRESIDYDEISYDQFTPTALDKPDETSAGDFEFYQLSVYIGDDVATGYALRNKKATYGRPVSVEVHEDSLNR